MDLSEELKWGLNGGKGNLKRRNEGLFMNRFGYLFIYIYI